MCDVCVYFLILQLYLHIFCALYLEILLIMVSYMDVEASTREPRVGQLRRPGFHLRELLHLRPKYEEVLPLPRGGLAKKKGRQHKSWEMWRNMDV